MIVFGDLIKEVIGELQRKLHFSELTLGLFCWLFYPLLANT
jgi:hypothetical protein